MVYNVCSINVVIAGIYRDFKPSNSGWNDDAIEWIGEAIGIMKVGQGFCNTWVDTVVSDFRAKLPCDIQSLNGVTYKGHRLRFNGGIPIRRTWACDAPFSNDTYTLNPSYINTSFKEGVIRIYYWGLPIDCDGYPMVIDKPEYLKALKWYVLMMMLGRGFKHQVFTYDRAASEWEKAYPKAQNACKMPNIDRMEAWKNNFLGLVKNLNRADNFFRDNGSINLDGANTPGTALQSFQILGDRLAD